MAKFVTIVHNALDRYTFREPLEIVMNTGGQIRGLYGQRVHRVAQTCKILASWGIIDKQYNLGGIAAYRRRFHDDQFQEILKERKRVS